MLEHEGPKKLIVRRYADRIYEQPPLLDFDEFDIEALRDDFYFSKQSAVFKYCHILAETARRLIDKRRDYANHPKYRPIFDRKIGEIEAKLSDARKKLLKVLNECEGITK